MAAMQLRPIIHNWKESIDTEEKSINMGEGKSIGFIAQEMTKKFPEASNKINDIGVQACIDFFDDKKLDRLIFISTCSNYGLIKEDELADENFELNPLSLYAKAKVAAELHLMSKKFQEVILN